MTDSTTKDPTAFEKVVLARQALAKAEDEMRVETALKREAERLEELRQKEEAAALYRDSKFDGAAGPIKRYVGVRGTAEGASLEIVSYRATTGWAELDFNELLSLRDVLDVVIRDYLR